MRRRTAAGIAVAALACALPAGAAASSIVYLKGGDLYVSGPEAVVEERLTASGGFESPSQADDGTVFAVTRTVEGGFRRGYVHSFERDGTPIARTRCGPANAHTYVGPLSAEVARDGSLLAFHYFQQPSEQPTAAYCRTDADAPTTEFGEIGGHFNPSWIGRDRVILFATSTFPNVITDPAGHAPDFASEGWFTDQAASLSTGAADRGLTKLAAVVSGGAEIRLYELTGPPPATPAYRCSFMSTPDSFERVSWSPDGRRFAFDAQNGIHIADVPALDDCSQVRSQLWLPGARDPHWGPAAAPRACVVPALKGKRLSRARAALAAAGCATGKVTRRRAKRSRRGRVIRQSHRPGGAWPYRTRVALVVGRR